jgi:pimeloyl-ACP methyl ester carboxylesterase
MKARVVSALGIACFGGISTVYTFTAQKVPIVSKLSDPHRKSVQLASTVSSPQLPTTVFVHGLDSSKETWTRPLSKLNKIGYPAIALDLRGHGESPLGNPEHFTAENLAHDVLSAVEKHGIDRPYVLVGHSMGGRIAMRLAAMDAEEFVQKKREPRLAACVIEDMDIQIRDGPKPAYESLDKDMINQLQSFHGARGRSFDSWEQCRDALLPCKT